MKCISCGKINPLSMQCLSMTECVCIDCQIQQSSDSQTVLLVRALEALNKSCTYCENESLSEHCGACKHGIVIKDIEKHLKGGKE